MRAAMSCRILLPLWLALAASGCGDMARLGEDATTGGNPTLAEPVRRLLPTVNIPEAQGWPANATPRAAPGLRVKAFARGLKHPRWLYALPNGDVLVVQSNAPPRPLDNAGLRGHAIRYFMRKAGAGVQSCDCITLLRDSDGDGVADFSTEFLSGLHSPFGVALVGETLYIANTDAIVSVAYRDGMTRVSTPVSELVALPAGMRNHHWTKNVVASNDGQRLYVSVGSNSNVAEHGMEAEENRAAILEVTLATRTWRVFASGLRNPNGMAWDAHGVLWTVVNERDELGSDLVPDYLTRVVDGGFYGWPAFYYGHHRDPRVEASGDQARDVLVPDYALGSHVAALGLAYAGVGSGIANFRHGMFIGEHGSWNRRPLAGYKVVFVPFGDGGPQGAPRDVLAGFVSADGKAFGRPVGVLLDRRGGLLVADDVGNVVWRVTATTGPEARSAPR
jgi:glucose/arabinose dehydrogenase